MPEPVIESDVREFVRRLPELTPLSAHIAMLAVRSRLSKEQLGFKSGDLVVERKIIRHRENWRDAYFNKVYNLAVAQRHGRYVVRNEVMPKETMGIFGTVAPRSVPGAAVEVSGNVGRWLYHQDVTMLDRLDVEFFAALHSHKSNDCPNKFVTVDVDDPEVFKPIMGILESFPIWMVTQTSRGYHIILDISDGPDCKSWGEAFYKPPGGVWLKIHEKYPKTVEVIQRGQEPIPGTFYHRPGNDKPNFVRILR